MTHSFPTRRSSDLQVKTVTIPGSGIANNGPVAGIFEYAAATVDLTIAVEVGIHDVARAPAISKIILIGICQVSIHLFLRSEEHTSELQSLMRISYAVFCLKTKKYNKSTKTL